MSLLFDIIREGRLAGFIGVVFLKIAFDLPLTPAGLVSLSSLEKRPFPSVAPSSRVGAKNPRLPMSDLGLSSLFQYEKCSTPSLKSLS